MMPRSGERGTQGVLGHYVSSVTNPGIEFVLFDLGGVIVELGGVSSLQEMAASVGDEEQWHQWLASPWVRRFEKGECSATEFSTQVVAGMGARCRPRPILRDLPGLADRPVPRDVGSVSRGPTIGADWMPEQYKLDALGTSDVFVAGPRHV